MPDTKTKTVIEQVPKKSYELPYYITGTMRLLEALSQKLALKFALKLFFTPLKFKIPDREKTVFENSNRLDAVTDKDIHFELFEWGDPNKPTVLLVHGWSGRGTQFFKLIEALLKQNYHIVSFDAPGHGKSNQKQTNLLEFTDCIRTINELHGPIKQAVGHSLGGAAIFNAINLGVPIDTVVTIGTPVNIKGVISDFCEKVRASKRTGTGIYQHIQNTFKVNTEEISTDYLASKYNPKGLIIHDTEDIDVGVENARALHQSWSNSELIITNGLGHRRVLNDTILIEKILDTLQK